MAQHAKCIDYYDEFRCALKTLPTENPPKIIDIVWLFNLVPVVNVEQRTFIKYGERWKRIETEACQGQTIESQNGAVTTALKAQYDSRMNGSWKGVLSCLCSDTFNFNFNDFSSGAIQLKTKENISPANESTIARRRVEKACLFYARFHADHFWRTYLWRIQCGTQYIWRYAWFVRSHSVGVTNNSYRTAHSVAIVHCAFIATQYFHGETVDVPPLEERSKLKDRPINKSFGKGDRGSFNYLNLSYERMSMCLLCNCLMPFMLLPLAVGYFVIWCIVLPCRFYYMCLSIHVFQYFPQIVFSKCQ